MLNVLKLNKIRLTAITCSISLGVLAGSAPTFAHTVIYPWYTGTTWYAQSTHTEPDVLFPDYSFKMQHLAWTNGTDDFSLFETILSDGTGSSNEVYLGAMTAYDGDSESNYVYLDWNCRQLSSVSNSWAETPGDHFDLSNPIVGIRIELKKDDCYSGGFPVIDEHYYQDNS